MPNHKITLTEQQKKYILDNYQHTSTEKLAATLNVKSKWMGKYLYDNNLKRQYKIKYNKYKRVDIALALEIFRNSTCSFKEISIMAGVSSNTLAEWVQKHLFPVLPNETTVIVTFPSEV